MGAALYIKHQLGPVAWEECGFVDNQFFELRGPSFKYKPKPWCRTFEDSQAQGVLIPDIRDLSAYERLVGHIFYLRFSSTVKVAPSRLTLVKCTFDSSKVIPDIFAK